MATPDVYLPTGTPVLSPKIMGSPILNPSSKETKEGLKRSFERYLAADNGSQAVGKLFNPRVHLAYEAPKHIHTMEDIGYSATSGVSPVAVSEPFRLFSEDAVNLSKSI